MNSELEFTHGNGSIRWWSVNAVKISETQYLGFSTDITERKQMEDRLRYMTEHDMLTDLHNRDFLENQLRSDLSKADGRKRALVGVNLSTVQLLTTNYGFQYTQNLMKQVAETLKNFVSESRSLFHVNENQFVFYLTNYHSRDELSLFGESLTEILESIFVTDRVGGGLGILELNAQETFTDVDSLLRRLFLASERAINIFERDYGVRYYDEALDAAVTREGMIRRALSAVVTDAGGSELFLQYQPIMDLQTNTTVSFEALARLRTEEFGLVSPLEFIPIAEETKMIIPMGEKIIRDALGFLHRLNKNGFDSLAISINISAIQLLSPNFTERLFQICEESQVLFKNVGIEITESIFASDYEKINGIIEQLREAGLHIAIDDFGTGYSSLAREKELNVDSLKIDKYFIDQLQETNRNKTITGDIISMAHKLGQPR
jgi:EAL domain-containing protein (putative c-di-GMP-specific phosphodiesterase class I)